MYCDLRIPLSLHLLRLGGSSESRVGDEAGVGGGPVALKHNDESERACLLHAPCFVHERAPATVSACARTRTPAYLRCQGQRGSRKGKGGGVKGENCINNYQAGGIYLN